jgi:hypothetical protein
LRSDDPSVRSAQKKLDKVVAEIRRQTELGEVRAARWRNAGALANGEQQQQVQGAEIADAALRIERELAALVFHAQGRGENVEHDVDADPRALLSISLVVAPPREQPTGTTPGYAYG